MDKRILKEISKRIAKSVLHNALEVALMDENDLLTDEEISFIVSELGVIRDKITDKPVYNDFNELIKEYYTFD